MNAQATLLKLDSIRTDGGTQSRALLSLSVVNEYANLFNDSNDILPPIKVFFDGQAYWVADGFHRLEAAKQANLESIAAFVEQGTRRDAILFSVGANAEHGLPRNDDDKRRAVTTLLTDEEWNNWSDNQIAKKCKVSQPFVSKLRKELEEPETTKPKRTYERNGKTHTMRTNNIGKSQPPQETQERNPNTKELFDDQPVEQSEPSYNEVDRFVVISQEKKIKELNKELEEVKNENGLLKLNARVLTEKQLNHDEEKLKQFNAELQLINITRQLAEIIGFNQDDSITWENVLDKLKEIMRLNNKVCEITETNNQLFVANENLVKELKDSAQKETDLENKLNDIRLFNVDIITLKESNQHLEEKVRRLVKENEALKETNNQLFSNNVDLEEQVNDLENEVKELKDELHKNNLEIITINQERYKLESQIKKAAVKPTNSNQLEKKLKEIKSIFELEMQKGLAKKEGVRLNRTRSTILLNEINQALGVE